MNSLKGFASLRILATVTLSLSMLAGCAGGNHGATASAYDRACRSPYMNAAAARQAFWCWEQAGVKSYDEWIALRSTETPANDGERIQVAATGIGIRQ